MCIDMVNVPVKPLKACAFYRHEAVLVSGRPRFAVDMSVQEGGHKLVAQLKVACDVLVLYDDCEEEVEEGVVDVNPNTSGRNEFVHVVHYTGGVVQLPCADPEAGAPVY